MPAIDRVSKAAVVALAAVSFTGCGQQEELVPEADGDRAAIAKTHALVPSDPVQSSTTLKNSNQKAPSAQSIPSEDIPSSVPAESQPIQNQKLQSDRQSVPSDELSVRKEISEIRSLPLCIMGRSNPDSVGPIAEEFVKTILPYIGADITLVKKGLEEQKAVQSKAISAALNLGASEDRDYAIAVTGESQSLTIKDSNGRVLAQSNDPKLIARQGIASICKDILKDCSKLQKTYSPGQVLTVIDHELFETIFRVGSTLSSGDDLVAKAYSRLSEK